MAPTTQKRGAVTLPETQRTLPFALLRAREAMMDRFRPMLRGIDVTEQQWRVLRVVQDAGEIDPTHLARTACVLAPSLTRILKSLEARDLITLRTDAADRRRTQVSISANGNVLLQEARQTGARIYTEIEERLGADRIADLLDMLDGMTRDLAASDTDVPDDK